MRLRKIKQKLPDFFKPIFWDCDYKLLDVEKNAEYIIIQTINYGDWQDWQWIFRYYGFKKTKKIIENIPASSFRPGSLKLVSLILGIKKLKYASRIDRIRAEKGIF